jgi:hypothetical protein
VRQSVFDASDPSAPPMSVNTDLKETYTPAAGFEETERQRASGWTTPKQRLGGTHGQSSTASQRKLQGLRTTAWAVRCFETGQGRKPRTS